MMMVWVFVGASVTAFSGVMVHVLNNVANPAVLAAQQQSNQRM